MHALLLIRIRIRTCALATRLQLRSDGVERYKWQPLHPRCHPLSKPELELGLVLGNASAKQRQVKNVFSFFLCFRFLSQRENYKQLLLLLQPLTPHCGYKIMKTASKNSKEKYVIS